MRFPSKPIGTVILALTLFALLIAPAAAQEGDRVSRPGEYAGYSEPQYTEWVRLSQYVPTRDGTRLAVDIYRPARDGQPVEEPLPLVWTHHRYHRANVTDGAITGIIDQAPELRTLLQYGYIVAAVDVRGGGASFGTREGEFTRQEALDAYDVTEWFAAQSWCDGQIGMYGLSYLGITQYMAASTQPPHLKAIFPMMAMFDIYSFVYPGGVFQENFLIHWGGNLVLLDKVVPAAPVDEDPGGALLAQARREHVRNANVYSVAAAQPFRNSQDAAGQMLHVEWSPSTYLDAINGSGVAIYTLGGWYDMYPRDAVTWFNNLTVPQKLLLTPWSHNGSGGFDLAVEHLRWFDYWLKGIDNGIMDEPPITYHVMGAPDSTAWRTAEQWPLPGEQPTAYYLHAGPSGSVNSANDGSLSTDPPGDGQDAYTVDYSTTTGKTTRWTDGYGQGFGYPEMTPNDEKGLTYTTAPLEADLEVTGHPVVHLWISSTADDGDFIVYLEEVDDDGDSTYITEGVLRASHRALADPPYDYMGLPYHRSFAEDVVPLPVDGEPVELVFDLHPTANIFDAGHRIRITITGADTDTYGTSKLDPPPTVTIYRSADYPSHIVLPVIPAD
ncbi:MAG: CocE/NonD family hydrolase [Chloroflexi bacterium]|nr:CocE/NonD family hydrolase [Chloroflexota bacterium]